MNKSSRRKFEKSTFLGNLPNDMRKLIWETLEEKLSLRDFVMLDYVYDSPTEEEKVKQQEYIPDPYYEAFEYPSEESDSSEEEYRRYRRRTIHNSSHFIYDSAGNKYYIGPKDQKPREF